MSDTQAATTKAAPLTPDICVIGAGSGGLSIATAAALFGVPVVLIERERMGGDRVAAGTISLRAAGLRAKAAREAGRFGISTGEAQVNYAQVHDHVRRASSALSANHSTERLRALGVTVIKGEARFISRSTVMVGGQAVKARRFIIATGSQPAIPSIPGLDSVPFLTAQGLLDLARRPDRLLVLGGGATGVELAQAMARLGSTVTIVETRTLLAHDDPEAVAIVRRALLRDGITVHEQATVRRAQSVKGSVRLILAGPGETEIAIEATHLLVAAGRRPDIEALDLEMAGVTSDARGVIVNKGLRTANRRVFAIGGSAGATDGQQFGHAANHHAGLVLRNALFRQPVNLGANAVPRVIHSDPELASVGVSEVQARERGLPLTILRWPYAENERAQAEHETDGFVKLVTDRKGLVLGVTIVGARAGDLIAPWCMAVQKRLSVKDMAGLVLPSQTFSEVATRAAVSFYAPLATKPGLRRLIGFLRRFG